MRPTLARALLAAGLGLMAMGSQPAMAGTSKLLLTGGVSSIEGAAGGGLTPWAVTGSQATEGEVGMTAFVARSVTSDYGLTATGVTVGLQDRLEISLAHQDLDTAQNLAPLGLGGLHLRQDIVGLKLKLVGDAVLDSDRLMPQLALGMQHKRMQAGALSPTLFGPLGARSSGTDLYACATKLFLAQGLLVNATLRLTQANQGGLLGFGSAQEDRLHLQPEFSVVKLLSRHVAIGAEYRFKPDALRRSALGDGALKEDDWFDVFVAWAPSKHLSLTAAYVDLGRIAPALQPRRQTGTYLSLQFGW